MATTDGGDVNRGVIMVRVLWGLAGTAGLIVGLGWYTKIALLRRVRSQDYIMTIALVCPFAPWER
jgi:hypothetical protein